MLDQRLPLSYEDSVTEKKDSSDKHHEQYLAIQKQFQTDVKSIMQRFEEKGNPFTEDSMDLVTAHGDDKAS